MVERIVRKHKRIYKCEECGLFYNEIKWAKKCEEWCKRYHTCNIMITKNRIKEKNNEADN